LALAKGFKIPKWLKISLFGKRPGWGEDDPIWSNRLIRDGWTLLDEGKVSREDYDANVWIELDPPRTFRKLHPILGKQYAIEKCIVGLKQKNGPWYLIKHFIVQNGIAVEALEGSDWADWSQKGDLLFASDGSLFRLPFIGDVLAPLKNARRLADFTKTKFEALEPPTEAQRWPSRK